MSDAGFDMLEALRKYKNLYNYLSYDMYPGRSEYFKEAVTAIEAVNDGNPDLEIEFGNCSATAQTIVDVFRLEFWLTEDDNNE